MFGLVAGSKVLIATSGSIDATLKAVLLLLLLIADVVNATDEIIGAPLVAALVLIPPSSSWSAQCTETVSSSRANANDANRNVVVVGISLFAKTITTYNKERK